MGKFGLDDWADLAKKWEWPALLLGNGASIAVSDRFSYGSLYTVAALTDGDRKIFDAIGTTNFEEVLNHLRTAELICKQLKHKSSQVNTRHEKIQEALIEAVNSHHVTWNDVDTGNRLKSIRAALRDHDFVFTTNYDLIVYWAMMNDGTPPGAGFGDLFWTSDHTFDPLDAEERSNKTFVYWLHGGLHLLRTDFGEAKKRTNNGSGLLNSFRQAKRPALFVSEGASKHKRRAIRRSDYLDHVYTRFAECDEDLVVFGQSLGAQDAHLIEAILQTPKRRVAYSVYPSGQADVGLAIAHAAKILPKAKLRFFDSTTHPLGDPALKVP